MTNDSPTAEASPAFSPTQRESRWLIALVFGGVAIRILAIVLQQGSLKTDPDAYVSHAETLRETGGFNIPGTEIPTAFRPPLYPMLLAALRLPGIKMTVAIGIVNVTAGAMLLIATWWTARVIGLRGFLPVVAAGAAVIDPMLLRYTALPMTEVLAAGLLSFAVLQVLKARLFAMAEASTELKSPQINSPMKSAIAAGVYFGLGGLCRPVILVVCAVLTICQVVEYCWRRFFFERTSSLSFSDAVRVIALPALITGLVMLPWVVRNAVQFHAFIPATTHGGYTLLLGNNPVFYAEVVEQPGQPAWNGESLNQWQQQLNKDLLADGVDQSDPTAVDRWMYGRAFANIEADLMTFLDACGLRWKRFFALVPNEQNSTSPVLWYALSAWYFVLWMGVLACWDLWAEAFLVSVRGGPLRRLGDRILGRTKSSKRPARRYGTFLRVADIQLLAMAVVSFLLLHTFYWTNARMRAPLMGILSLLAVVGWRHIVEVYQYWKPARHR